MYMGTHLKVAVYEVLMKSLVIRLGKTYDYR